MADIVGLRGHIPINPHGKPDADVVEQAEWLLNAAKSGEIVGIAGVLLWRDLATCTMVAGFASYAQLGQLVALQSRLLKTLGDQPTMSQDQINRMEAILNQAAKAYDARLDADADADAEMSAALGKWLVMGENTDFTAPDAKPSNPPKPIAVTMEKGGRIHSIKATSVAVCDELNGWRTHVQS